jgi:hypothetical protein
VSELAQTPVPEEKDAEENDPARCGS